MSVPSPVRRLAAAHWPLPAVCALFLLMGALTLDDYGISPDESGQRAIGRAALDSLAGGGEHALAQLRHPSNRYYGAVFEAPLALLERALGPDDPRAVFLARRLLTHLLFLAGGVACYLLVLRMFNSKLLALGAMVLFLLHPRLHAHSFFNSKDIPFLAMFMVSLFLTHRAFQRNTLAAFLLCGAGVGLLVNLRIMGLVLFAAVFALRALDLLTADGPEERKRILLTGGALALAATLTFYVALPALWTDPVGQFAEMIRALHSQPPSTVNLFRGEWLYSPNGPPLDYVPVWIAITTPPATLLLALAGGVATAWRGLRQPRAALRNGPSRFNLLLLALPVVTVATVVVLEPNIYNGWRHVYFLYAPLLLLGVVGIRQLAAMRGRWMRAGVYALTGAAMAVTIVSMVRIHPHQSDYFTVLVDRTTPERLASRYGMDYWELSSRSVLGDILGAHPSGSLFLATDEDRNIKLLPATERERIAITRDFRSGAANFHDLFFRDLSRRCPASSLPGTYTARVYGSTVECLVDPVAWFGALRREALASEPLDRSRFDAYRVGNHIVYLRDGCSASTIGLRFWLRVHPADPADLPTHHREFPDHRGEYGFEKRDFDFARYGARIDGDCVVVAPLPDYAIARIRTGQFTPEYAGAALRAVADGKPLVRSRFDIHLDSAGRTLTYVRGDCSADDAAARFVLHVFPTDEDDLPDDRRRHGFDNFDFSLREYGARTDGGGCVAAVPLPAYSIARIRTGQFTASGERWAAEFAMPNGE